MHTNSVGDWATGLSVMLSTQATQSSPAPIPFYKEVAATGGYFDWDYGFLAKISFITVAIEYLVVYLLLGRPTKARPQLLFYTALVNVVTKPAEQFAIVFLADPDLLGSTALSLLVLCFIELVVVTVEFGFMRCIFRRMYLRGTIHESVSPGRTFVVALVANLCSFAIGNIGLLALVAATSK